MSIPPPLTAGDFSRVLSGLVKSLSLLFNRYMQQKTSGNQGTPQAFAVVEITVGHRTSSDQNAVNVQLILQ